MGLQNQVVDAIDVDDERIGVLKTMVEQTGLGGINPMQASLETYDCDVKYDAIFCYSAVYMTDIPRSIRNLTSKLAAGGIIYFNTNDLGWYLYNIVSPHNDADDFSSQEFGIAAILNTLKWLYGEGRSSSFPVVLTQSQFFGELRKAGLSIVAYGPDGSINFSQGRTRSFFAGEFMGVTSVYEVLCTKDA